MDIHDALMACEERPGRHATVEFSVKVGRLSGIDYREAAEAIAALAGQLGVGYEVRGQGGPVTSTLLLKLDGEASAVATLIRAVVEAADDLRELRNLRSRAAP